MGAFATRSLLSRQVYFDDEFRHRSQPNWQLVGYVLIALGCLAIGAWGLRQ